jgi:glycosyltransferase involved in cell wall biosynthesis
VKEEKFPIKAAKKRKILLELRPALEGFAGIPQEARLLFLGLRSIPNNDVQGMIQTSHTILSRGTTSGWNWTRLEGASAARRFNRYSRFIVSMMEKPYRTFLDKIIDNVERRLATIRLTLLTLLGVRKIKLTNFEPLHFEDFVWRTMFAKSLPSSEYGKVTSASMKICSTPWHIMHLVGLHTLNLLRTPKYPSLIAKDFDIFISQTPYPGRILGGAALVVRYHDAIPVFFPHTIPDKAIHQATHFYALMANVKAGGYFACVSEATRLSLLSLFPEAADRTVTIHNIVSPHYFYEDSNRERTVEIIRSRLLGRDIDARDLELSPKFLTLREQETFYQRVLDTKSFKYLMVVCSIEPRKNHARLLAAWEALMTEDPEMKLVVVGSLGWDYTLLLKGFRTWIDRGRLFMLNAVPAPDLRVLYRHAAATVCPSIAEGFDFSGAESMRCGGVVIASDIEVHREIYDDAAEYFDPYSTASLLKAIKKVIYEPGAAQLQDKMRARGTEVAARYVPEKILPQWEAFLARVMQEKKSPFARIRGGEQGGSGAVALPPAELGVPVVAEDFKSKVSGEGVSSAGSAAD